ncbi:FeoB small GTPase domain-containing protein, partial [Desulfosporosinus sp. PR]|uniref:FeoB small GTPase domain-containing protein n=1 Tax=Candidatus Desulfosporosinus nitrosoreducens TaxID=3401928 RepID=UPI0027F5B026
MGLTSTSTGAELLNYCGLHIARETQQDKIVALAGNPNVGKSTVFNSLTGLNQHTGNWPGKTVLNAQGKYRHQSKNYIMVDIPGTYSLMANSTEEEIARDFICFGGADAVVIVADATCLERNLNLVLQTMEITDKVVLCVNLMDEAQKKKIRINLDLLAASLGIPVVGTSARSGRGLDHLMNAVSSLTENSLQVNPLFLTYSAEIEK